MDAIKNMVLTAKAIHAELSNELKPPEEGLHAKTQPVINMSLVRGTRGYIERIANQVNGAYENGWYDAAAVMLRRLIETLIIEVFEKHAISDRIKNGAGDFFVSARPHHSHTRRRHMELEPKHKKRTAKAEGHRGQIRSQSALHRSPYRYRATDPGR